MLVKSINNRINDIPESIRNYAYHQLENGTLPLTIGKEYVVSGIRKTLGYTFYLIVDDEDLQWCPWWFPAELFEVMDDAIPDNWVAGGDKGEDEYLTFPELAADRTEGGLFSSNLQDGDEPEMAVFLGHYKKYLADYDRKY